MLKSWQILIIIAFVIVLLYVGFDFYNSFSGENVEFEKVIEPIDLSLNEEVLQHVELADSELPYNLSDEAEDLSRIRLSN